MSVQLPPAVAQRRHWYAYEIGAVPDQVPGSSVSVSAAWAVPEIVGGDVFEGAVGAAVTVAVCAEAALLEPTVAAVSTYVCAFAPARSAQTRPLVSQRRHW